MEEAFDERDSLRSEVERLTKERDEAKANLPEANATSPADGPILRAVRQALGCGPTCSVTQTARNVVSELATTKAKLAEAEKELERLRTLIEEEDLGSVKELREKLAALRKELQWFEDGINAFPTVFCRFVPQNAIHLVAPVLKPPTNQDNR